MAAREGRGCLKTGCFGCLGVVAILVVFLIVMSILTVVDRSESRTERISRTTPVRESPRGVLSPLAHVDEPGRIILDVRQASFFIEPGPPGSELRVEADFDAGRFELEESTSTYGERGWEYELRFGRRRFSFNSFIFSDETSNNEIRLIVPRDLPIKLEGAVGMGQSRADLGGLWVVDVDLEIGVGEHAFSFDEPLRMPMARFAIDAGVGELRVHDLGNASPAQVEIEHNIGEVSIDLDGQWMRDSEISVRCGIGECGVDVPRHVALDLDAVRVTLGEASSPRDRPVEEGMPTLHLHVSASIGEVRVDR